MPERLTPFAFEEQLVRCRLDERGEPWFVAKDVALALGYQWAGIRNVQHIPEEWRLVESVSTSFGDKQTWFLSEQGLYFFVARSDKPRALPFQKYEQQGAAHGQARQPALHGSINLVHNCCQPFIRKYGGLPGKRILRVGLYPASSRRGALPLPPPPR